MKVACPRLPAFFGSVLKLKKVSFKTDPLRADRRYIYIGGCQNQKKHEKKEVHLFRKRSTSFSEKMQNVGGGVKINQKDANIIFIRFQANLTRIVVHVTVFELSSVFECSKLKWEELDCLIKLKRSRNRHKLESL